MGQCVEELTQLWNLSVHSMLGTSWLFLLGGNWIKTNKKALLFVFEDSKEECN